MKIGTGHKLILIHGGKKNGVKVYVYIYIKQNFIGCASDYFASLDLQVINETLEGNM